ncbi:MAG: metallopeptidase TldD-related protein [Rhodobacteraceae bacterium]|nr:metallopeptidase TldD-related protein [Paracoccaceae bacterium]
MKLNAQNIAGVLLAEADQAGADAADAIVIDADSVEIEVRDGGLENVGRSEGAEVGLRVLIGCKQACVSGSDLRPETLRTMARAAVDMAQAAPEDQFAGLARSDQITEIHDVAALELADPAEPPALREMESMALQAEAAALAVKGVAKTESAAVGCGRQSVHLAASNGFQGSYERSSVSASCAAISGSGLEMEVDYCFESRVFLLDLPDCETIGRCAGERAAARAGSTRPPTGAFPVLFDERVSSTLVGHLLSAVNGTAVARGSSWLLDAMGEQVLPPGTELSEDPLLPRSGSSRPFDAEGLPVRNRRIVSDGRLQSWTLDLATARKLGLQSTGNASRGVGSAPSPGVTNIRFPDGTKSRAELVEEMGTGLIVTSLIGSTINPTTGDYSRGASGFWVENGYITRPVSEFTIAGNLRKFLKTVIPADDSRPFRKFRVPSLLVEGLTVAGG